METVKFLCEFFFGDFWHWLGLVVILAIIVNTPLIYIGKRKED